MRCSKPAAEIYRHCLEGLGVAPEQALFLDDREPNIEGAQQLGIHGLIFTNVAAAVAQLNGQYVLPELGLS